MSTTLLRLLSREWAGLAVASAVLLLGAALWRLPESWRWLGAGLLGLGVLLALGALWHLMHLAAIRRRYPPPGKLVDLGGYRVHVLAEGEAKGGALPIVWFGGSHSSGLAMHHVHRALAHVTRSILIDRPGTGWSDTGPFPRTTAREADEMVEALARAGEQGPFVFAGYSFGGLLVANIARRRPDLCAKLILLDATPPETIVFGPRFDALNKMRADAVNSALLRLFGLHTDLNQRRVERTPGYAEVTKQFRETMGEQTLNASRAIECSAGSQLANYSIYRELSPEGIAACAWDLVVYDGDLGDLPVFLVAPGSAEEVAAEPEVASAQGAEMQRMMRFFAKSRERYMATSSNAVRIVTPPGTTHQFVYQRPDFVIETVSRIVTA